MDAETRLREILGKGPDEVTGEELEWARLTLERCHYDPSWLNKLSLASPKFMASQYLELTITGSSFVHRVRVG